MHSVGSATIIPTFQIMLSGNPPWDGGSLSGDPTVNPSAIHNRMKMWLMAMKADTNLGLRMQCLKNETSQHLVNELFKAMTLFRCELIYPNSAKAYYVYSPRTGYT